MTEYKSNLVGTIISITEDKKFGLIKCGEDTYPFGFKDQIFDFEIGQMVTFDGLYQDFFLFAYNVRNYIEVADKPLAKTLVKDNTIND